ncbi:redoxin domain-containing protein, partial [Singulisphaera rosea]
MTMPRPFHVPAEGVVDYQSFEVDPGFNEDRWIHSAEIRPGNRKVVHHCNVFLKSPGGQGDADAQGELGSYCLAATTPGSPPMSLPSGMAKRIPAGWKLVFVLHYTPVGTPQDDQTSLGLVFADPKSVKKEVATNLMFDPALRIPPRAADYRVVHTRRFDDDVLLLSLFPHMHLRGKSFRYEAIAPDGGVEVLLDVPRYDFNWQNRYELTEPKRLPAGTTLRCIAHFDNSAANPSNPDPDAVVLAGKQSWEEMFNGYYDIALADQDLTR